ncbi:polyprenyl synthetase family protein [Occultella kanbiaonis]|uniref:polyprenyl synthetase family protein n=1 Tax=Occultella kanbiaonis TaxID=2675754 RepID=UPI00143D7C48|nr:polyprenyl synthetase family protein [Occultella kanbiaonis]
MTRIAEDDEHTVAAYLDHYFVQQIERAASYGAHYRRLWESARDTGAGGKRLRPRLLLLAHGHLAPGARSLQRADAVEMAAAFELLHTAFLIHDDVIDHDLVRRGRPNVQSRAVIAAIDQGAGPDRAADYGQAAAILAGDLLISGAHLIVAGLAARAGIRRRLLDLIDGCVFRTVAGEHADVWAAMSGRTGETDALAVIETKTVSYSFGAPLQAGALLAGAATAVLDGLGRVGGHLGVAFQLRDDVLGVFGSEEATGKSAIGDLREGKATTLIAYARRDPDWAAAAEAFGRRDLDEAQAERIREAIRGCGALDAVEQLIAKEVATAQSLLAALDVPDGLRQALATTARTVGRRTR